MEKNEKTGADTNEIPHIESNIHRYLNNKSFRMMLIPLIAIALLVIFLILAKRDLPQSPVISSAKPELTASAKQPTRPVPTNSPPSKGQSLWLNTYNEHCTKDYIPDSFDLDISKLGIEIVNPNVKQKSAHCNQIGGVFSFTFNASNRTEISVSTDYYSKSYAEYINTSAYYPDAFPKLRRSLDESTESKSINLTLKLDINCHPAECTPDETSVTLTALRKLILPNGDEIHLIVDETVVDRGNSTLINLINQHGTFRNGDAYKEPYKIVDTLDFDLLYRDFGQDIDQYSRAITEVLHAIEADEKVLSNPPLPSPIFGNNIINATITKADVTCTRKSTGNGCTGDITYFTDDPSKPFTNYISLQDVYDNKTNEMDGALLYAANRKPLPAIIEFEAGSSKIKKITITAGD